MAEFIHIPFDQREFSRWAGARSRGLVSERSCDVGLAMHVLVASVFPKGTVQPYRVVMPERRRVGSFYGYTNATADDLVKIANSALGPDNADIFNMNALRGRAVPTVEMNQRVGFDIKIRPTRRSKGYEADACWMGGREWNGQGQSCDEDRVTTSMREKVYGQWLAERLQGAADVNICRLAHFRQSPASFGRGRRSIDLPEATLHGDMTISDPVAFREKMLVGVGRHKAYGYGMILLRPPATLA